MGDILLAFLIYLFLFFALIYQNGFFGLFKDEAISTKQFSIFFLVKALAVPVFYLLYKFAYGGIENFDAGIFYHDAEILNTHGKQYPASYFLALVGLQDDSPGSFFYTHYIEQSTNWDNGRIRVFFYNDNRIVIRLHSLLHFIAFGSYFVHALFNCFLSFIGCFFIYKSFKPYFQKKEIWLCAVLCLFPTLWLHTGAVLKEGITLFVLGLLLYHLKLVFTKNFGVGSIGLLLLLVVMSFFLKPYLLLFAFLSFSLFFFLESVKLKAKTAWFVFLLLGFSFLANQLTQLFKGKSFYEIAQTRQRVFADAAKGGIFLLDSLKFIRLEFDSNLVSPVTNKPNFFRIKQSVPYIYWEHHHQQDTLICRSNADTLSVYQLVYKIPESGSNLNYQSEDGGLRFLVKTMYYTLAYPLFFNARGGIQIIASFENLLLLLCLLVSLYGVIYSKKTRFLAVTFLAFAFGIFMLVGFTSPNSGAIFRYRSPGVIFVLLTALYYIDEFFLKKESTDI